MYYILAASIAVSGALRGSLLAIKDDTILIAIHVATTTT
jgi:hypothetical protein